MIVNYLSIVLFCASRIRDVYCPIPRRSNSNLTRSPSGYLNFQAPAAPSTNPCDWTRVTYGAKDAHKSCDKACLEIKTVINDIFTDNPDYSTVQYLHAKCGSLNAGKCSFPPKVSFYPACWCYSSYGTKDEQSTPLFVCRIGIPVVRTISNAGIGVTRYLSGSIDNPRPTSTLDRVSSWLRPKTPGITVRIKEENEEQEEDDGEEEGAMLVADFHIEGQKIRALMDTGSSSTLIPKRFAKKTDELQIPRTISTVDGTVNQVIYGKTTINVEIKYGITIPIKGLVTESDEDLLLGCDFFIEYAARIKILKRRMKITVNGTDLIFRIKFRHPFLPGRILALYTDPGGYSPLMISVWLNDEEKQVEIDTCATWSVVSKDVVNPENTLRKDISMNSHQDFKIAFEEATNVELWIGSEFGVEGIGFITRALVAPFEVENTFILGNSFNKNVIEVIDFKRKHVIFKSPADEERVKTPLLITKIAPEFV